ncbi:MAG: RlmE family RNA methyltransferase [Pseudomonadota bacterium]
MVKPSPPPGRKANRAARAKTGVEGKARARKSAIERTALGEEPEKRTRKSVAAKTGRKLDDKNADGLRELRVNVKTAKYRKTSSTKWLMRQLNDPFVAKAKAEGYRSRAAYKLIELDEKFTLLKPGAKIVDLGCAPGGWCQVAVKGVGARGAVVGIDYLNMDSVAGADVLEMDFLDDDAPSRLKALLKGEADLVLSDMAAPTTGHKATDHLRIVALADAALDFAIDVLSPGGGFISKVFQGGAEGELLNRLKRNFTTVKHAKPKASRQESAEMYVVAIGFRGSPNARGGDGTGPLEQGDKAP